MVICVNCEDLSISAHTANAEVANPTIAETRMRRYKDAPLSPKGREFNSSRRSWRPA
jgi:hypothetical protein